MDSLGVRVVIVSAIAGVARCNVGDCDWSHEGTSEECQVAGEAHRAEEHQWIRPSRYVTATGSADALAALDAGVSQRELLLDVQEVLETRDCLALSCDREAEPDEDYCRVCLAGSRLQGTVVVAPVDLYDPPPLIDPPPAPEPEPEEEEPPVTTAIGWNREGIINAIRSHNEMYGRPPKSSEWNAAEHGHPSAGQVSREFGTWADGIEAAGFPRPTRGGSQKAPLAPSEPAHDDERDVAGSGAPHVRTIEEDAQGVPEDRHRLWVASLGLDSAALLAEADRLAAESEGLRQRELYLRRVIEAVEALEDA